MEIKELQEKMVKFRDQRDWKQFHNPKDMAVSLTLEAAELLEHFQWKSIEEMADIFYWVLLMGHDFQIDLIKSFNKKMRQNAKKYPVKKAKGKHSKYTDYQ